MQQGGRGFIGFENEASPNHILAEQSTLASLLKAGSPSSKPRIRSRLNIIRKSRLLSPSILGR